MVLAEYEQYLHQKIADDAAVANERIEFGADARAEQEAHLRRTSALRAQLVKVQDVKPFLPVLPHHREVIEALGRKGIRLCFHIPRRIGGAED